MTEPDINLETFRDTRSA